MMLDRWFGELVEAGVGAVQVPKTPFFRLYAHRIKTVQSSWADSNSSSNLNLQMKFRDEHQRLNCQKGLLKRSRDERSHRPASATRRKKNRSATAGQQVLDELEHPTRIVAGTRLLLYSY